LLVLQKDMEYLGVSHPYSVTVETNESSE